MKVAVYGTLKKGGRLHMHMQSIEASFIEDAVLKDHQMYNLGWFPAIIEKEGSKINVEVYDVDENGLRRLDGIEGYPHLYQRKDTEHGLVYYMQDPDSVVGAELIEDGNWDTNKR